MIAGRTDQTKKPTKKSKKFPLWPIAAATAVVAAVVGAVVALSGGTDGGEPIARHKAAREAAAIPNARQVVPKPQKVAKSLEATKDCEVLPGETPEMARLRNEEPTKYAAMTNRAAKREAAMDRIAKEPVKGLAEQLLMLAFPSERGDLMPPMPIPEGMDDELEAAAERMLERVIEVEDHDTEDSLLTKERLLVLREEWAKAKANGVSFGDFLRERQTRAQIDAEHYGDAMALERENYNDESITDDEYLKAREKINTYLQVQGFRELPVLEEEQDALFEAADEAAAEAAKKENGD